MKTLDYLHLDASAANKVVEALQQLLADYQVFYTNLRGFHWNIKGHGFFVLHSKFEEMYDDAAEKVDELAERILMLGGVPVNKFSEYLKVAFFSTILRSAPGCAALKKRCIKTPSSPYSCIHLKCRSTVLLSFELKKRAAVPSFSFNPVG